MSGTNKNRKLLTGGPVIILVEPQLGENIGMVARAMANFGMDRLRLVNPRDGWPNEKAVAAASRADHVIEKASVFPDLQAAIADLNRVMATTARQRDMVKPVLNASDGVALAHERMAGGQNVGILFGRERWGLENNEIALADEIVTFPVNPAFASLNIAQAVLIIAYEWMQAAVSASPEFSVTEQPPANRKSLIDLFEHLESALEDAHYFFPPEKKERMVLNLRNMLTNAGFREPEIQSLRGVIAALERRWQQKKERVETNDR